LEPAQLLTKTLIENVINQAINATSSTEASAI
jgi:hypothetical protein